MLLLLLVKLLDALRVGSSDEVCLHVVNFALRVHEVLLVLALDLDHAHDHAINHVDGLALIVAIVLIHGLLGVVAIFQLGFSSVHVNVRVVLGILPHRLLLVILVLVVLLVVLHKHLLLAVAGHGGVRNQVVLDTLQGR